jgi:hypothetical protein
VTATFTLKPNIIFVSSTQTTGLIDLPGMTAGGLAGGDRICAKLASAANLPGTYVALLSASSGGVTTNALSRVGAASGWVRVDGKPVANAITQFTTGLFNPPLLTETGVDVSNMGISVWTGTTKAGVFQNQCTIAGAVAPWSGQAGTVDFGFCNSTTPTALEVDVDSCQQMMRIYCLGTDRTAIAQ